MERVVVWVIAGHNASDDLAVLLRQKKGRVTVAIKRVPFTIQESFSLDDQRRNPSRIVPVNSPWKLDEFISLGARTNLGNRNGIRAHALCCCAVRNCSS